MTTYQPQTPDPHYQPHRGSLSAGMPAPAQQRGSMSQGYYHSGTPTYDPHMSQQHGLAPEAAARRFSLPDGPTQPAVSPYTPVSQPAQYDSQRQGYFPQHPPPPPQTYPPSSYPPPTNQPPPQAFRPYPPQQQQRPYPSAVDDGVTFDQGVYMHGPPPNGNGAYNQRPRAYSSGQYSYNGSDGYERDGYDRRASYAGRTHSPRRDERRSRRPSHHSYIDEYGEKHYHGRDKRPTYGDSILFAWDKAVDFISGKRD